MKTTKKKLAIGKDRMNALRDEQCNITHNLDEIVKVAGRFYTRLYASNGRPREATESTSSTCDVPLVTKEEVGKVLKDMKIGKAAGDDGITIGLLKEEADNVQEKLAVAISECLKTQKVPIA